MNVIALIGSPRKNGSTARLVQEILKGAMEKGVEAKVYYLNELNIKGCQGCHSCISKPTATCVQNDDVNRILTDISNADGVIFGTPVYMASMTGQMKTMLDRLYPFTRQDNSSKMQNGKKAIWAITQRNPDETRYMPVFETLMFPMKFLGFAECKFMVASGTPSLEALLLQQDKLQDAFSLGGWLSNSVRLWHIHRNQQFSLYHSQTIDITGIFHNL